MQRKEDFVRAVHNRREPQRHLLEKNGTCKFCKLCDEVLKISQEFLEEKFWRNTQIPRDYVFYAVHRKIRKIRDQVLIISQEFPEKYYREILMNFLGKIPKKFSGISLN